MSFMPSDRADTETEVEEIVQCMEYTTAKIFKGKATTTSKPNIRGSHLPKSFVLSKTIYTVKPLVASHVF